MKTLIRNVSVFNGNDATLQEEAKIVIDGNIVTEILTGDVDERAFEQVIDGKGMVAMPGLIDCHIHMSMTTPGSLQDEMRMDEIAVRSVRFAHEMLLRGFTTVRDAGGLTYGLKASIDNGYTDGPRIYPSNAYLSQTCGHGDLRGNAAEERDPNGTYPSPSMRMGMAALCDGVPEVLRSAREQLYLGASQIKIMAGGGLSSRLDHLWTLQFTEEEMRAAVQAAEDFGTYVMAHLYTPEAMQRAARAGVKSFEHGTLMDEKTARMITDMGIWVCPCPQFGRPGGGPPKGVVPKVPIEYMINAENQETELINRFDIPIVYGTDATGVPEHVEEVQLDDFHYVKKRFGSLKGLRAATGNAGKVLAMSTHQNPYWQGKVGVLEPGAFADLLLVSGNPVEDLDVLRTKENIRLIMKDGTIYKNTMNM